LPASSSVCIVQSNQQKKDNRFIVVVVQIALWVVTSQLPLFAKRMKLHLNLLRWNHL